MSKTQKVGGGALGPDHLDVAASLNNVGLLYNTRGHVSLLHQTQGPYAQAGPHYRRSLAIMRSLTILEEAFPPYHPDVAASLENLADLYRNTGPEEAAAELEQRAAAIRAVNR